MPRNDYFRDLHLLLQPDLVQKCLSSSLPASTPYLGEILRREVPDDERIQKLARKLLICGSWASRIVRGEEIWFTVRCRRPICPRCSCTLRVQEAEKVWKKFKNGGRLRRADFSAVTIDTERLELGSDFSKARDDLFSRCRKIAERHLSGSRWAVYVEIAHDWNWTGRLHLHGIIHHPGWSQEEVEAVLAERFPGHLAVDVQPLHEEQSIKEGVLGFCAYAVHKSLKIEREWGISDRDVPAYLADLVKSYLSLIKRGLMGLRLEIGLRRNNSIRVAEENEGNYEKCTGHFRVVPPEEEDLGKSNMQYKRTGSLWRTPGVEAESNRAYIDGTTAGTPRPSAELKKARQCEDAGPSISPLRTGHGRSRIRPNCAKNPSSPLSKS